MEVIKINPKRIDKRKIDYIVKYLQEGRVVILPTDTSYGLAVNATNKGAVNQIYKIKKRSKNSPLSIIVKNINWVKEYCNIDERIKKLFDIFLPGPLTIIIPKNNNKLSTLITSKGDIGFRIPDNKVIDKVMKKINFPITATSANISKEKEPYSVKEILKQYKNKKYKPDLIVDVGKLPKNKPSTIVDLSDDKIKLIRLGPINFKDVVDSLKN